MSSSDLLPSIPVLSTSISNEFVVACVERRTTSLEFKAQMANIGSSGLFSLAERLNAFRAAKVERTSSK